MYCLETEVVSNKQVLEDIFEIILENKIISEIAKPGQFLHINIKGYGVLLRRPISICKVDKAKNLLTLLYQVKGNGTKHMSDIKAGEMLNVLGPLGNGFPIENESRCAIVGGGIGTAPLLELAAALGNCDAYLGYRNMSYYDEKFKAVCKNVYVATETGIVGCKGYITDLLAGNLDKYDVIYTCGPKVMMRKVKELCIEKSIKCYASLEEKMGCGIGACLVCNCKTETADGNWHYSKVCTDGPVFNALEVLLDE